MAGAGGADTRPWTNLGLQTLSNTDVIQRALQNIAFLLETNFQNATDDPNFSKRTSNQNKMVHTSYPRSNPPYPIFVLSGTSAFGRGTGKGHGRKIFDIEVLVASKTVKDTDQLSDKAFSLLMADATRESLVDKNQTWHSTNYLFNVVGTVQDSTRSNIFTNAHTWRFFAQINS